MRPTGQNGTVHGVTHFYVHTGNGVTTLPTLTVTNALTGGNGTWKLYHELDNLSAIPTSTPIAGGTITAGVSNSTIAPTVTTADYCYHLVYDDSAATNSSTFSWPAGSKVVIAATPKEPLPSLTISNNGTTVGKRYFYVPKGTTNIRITASKIENGSIDFFTATGTSPVKTQIASNSSVIIDIPVPTNADGKIWTMRNSSAAVATKITNLVFQNTPGYLAVDADQLLIPQWMSIEAQGLY